MTSILPSARYFGSIAPSLAKSHFSKTYSTYLNRIVEVKHFSEIHKYIRPRTLAAIDYDNTIGEPVQTAGSDQWFSWRKKWYLKQGMVAEMAVEKALVDWIALQNVTKVRLVEPDTNKHIAALQDKEYPVMGLTTRGVSLATCTHLQLESMHINLTRTAPTNREVVFLNPHREVAFIQGVLFTGGTHKGKALFNFLERVKPFSPKHILFINDNVSHLKQVAESCDQHKVDFTGLRYGYTDEKVAAFNEEVAKNQFDHFARIISDEQAKQNLNRKV